ncbi:MAG: hypothetical protein AAGU21_19475 [Solidesulfovibrio sp.]|uniref:hypothetical protein n=1 Tax=Solidesulfovibrio sp. TaxID=2910990 RepID=UPI00315955C3
MLAYNIAQCLACDELVNLWVGVGLAERQPMVFLCPYCGSELHIILVLDYKKITTKIESNDIVIVDEERDESRKGVNLYADLPVRKDKQGVSMAQGGSAFMDFSGQIPWDEFVDYNKFKDKIHSLYQVVYPTIRRTKELYLIENYEALARQLKKINGIQLKNDEPKNVIATYHNILMNFGLPDFEDVILKAAFSNIFSNFIDCQKKYSDKTIDLLSSFWNKHRYAVFSRRLIDVFLAFMSKFDALNLGVAYSLLIEAGCNLNDYLVFRSDFNELKSIYVDGYEIAMQGLTFIIPIYNLAVRGDSECWSNGVNEPLYKFTKKTSYNKEFSFNNEPALRNIYTGMNRNLRNKIGHNDILFIFKSQEIILGQGDTILLADFLESFINVYKVIGYLLCFENLMKISKLK